MSTVLEQSIASQIGTVREFRALLNEKYQDEWETIRDLGGDEDDGIEFYADEGWVLGEIRRLGEQLAIVALYRIVEHNMMRLVSGRWSKARVQREQLYKFDRLRQFLNAEAGLDIGAMPGFGVINALRVANNVVKHEFERPATGPQSALSDSVEMGLDAVFLDGCAAASTFLVSLEKSLKNGR